MSWLLVIIVSASGWNDVTRREEYRFPGKQECRDAIVWVKPAPNTTAFCVEEGSRVRLPEVQEPRS